MPGRQPELTLRGPAQKNFAGFWNPSLAELLTPLSKIRKSKYDGSYRGDPDSGRGIVLQESRGERVEFRDSNRPAESSGLKDPQYPAPMRNTKTCQRPGLVEFGGFTKGFTLGP